MSVEEEKRCRPRSRATNYIQSEKDKLVSIIFIYRNIIENKKTDHKTIKEKEAAWDKIAELFNHEAELNRDVTSLKMLWGNIKRRCKKTQASFEAGLRNTEKEATAKFDSKVRSIMSVSEAEDCHTKLEEDMMINGKNNIQTEDGELVEDEWSEWMPDLQNHLPDNDRAICKAKEFPVVVNLCELNGDTMAHTEHVESDSSDISVKINKKLKIPQQKRTLEKTSQDLYWEEKRKYIKQEEQRKAQLHKLQVIEQKLKIEMLQFQLEEMKNKII